MQLGLWQQYLLSWVATHNRRQISAPQATHRIWGMVSMLAAGVILAWGSGLSCAGCFQVMLCGCQLILRHEWLHIPIDRCCGVLAEAGGVETVNKRRGRRFSSAQSYDNRRAVCHFPEKVTSVLWTLDSCPDSKCGSATQEGFTSVGPTHSEHIGSRRVLQLVSGGFHGLILLE